MVLGLGILTIFTAIDNYRTPDETKDQEKQKNREELVRKAEKYRPEETGKDVTKTPEFQTFYYDNQTNKLSWELTGTQSRLVKDGGHLWIQSPNMTYFPDQKKTTDGERKNTVHLKAKESTLNNGEKEALLRNKVFVESKEGILKTDELQSKFDEGKIHTKQKNDVHLKFPNVEIDGAGFSGNTELESFMVLRDIEITVGRNRSGQKSPQEPPSERSLTRGKIKIYAKGPMYMEKQYPGTPSRNKTSSSQSNRTSPLENTRFFSTQNVNNPFKSTHSNLEFGSKREVSTPSNPYWNLTIFNDVFLYRAGRNEPMKIRSDNMAVRLIKEGNQKTNEPSKTTIEPENLQARLIHAVDQVRVNDPRFDMTGRNLLVERKRNRETITITGPHQTAHFYEVPANLWMNPKPKTTLVKSEETETPELEITFTGRGKIVRKFSEKNTGNSSDEKVPITANFRQNVRLSQMDKTFFASRMNMYFDRVSQQKQKQDRSISSNNQRPPEREHEDPSRSGPKKRKKLKPVRLEGNQNILMMEEGRASKGKKFSWSFQKEYITLRDSEGAHISDLLNTLQGREIKLVNDEGLLIARKDVKSEFFVRKNKKIAAFFPGKTGATGKTPPPETSDDGSNENNSSSNNSRTHWQLTSDRMNVVMPREKISRLGRVKATGNVHIRSDQRSGWGNTFILDRDRSYVALKSNDIARLHEGKHRIKSHVFEFYPDQDRIHLRGWTSMKLVERQNSSILSQNSGVHPDDHDERSNPDKTNSSSLNTVRVVTRHPVVVRQKKQSIEFLGRAQLKATGSALRANRLRMIYRQQEQSPLKDLRAVGDVWIHDRKGTGRGDIANWKREEDKLTIRGQPSANVRFRRTPVRYEIVKISENWTRYQGEQYKWTRSGEIRRDN